MSLHHNHLPDSRPPSFGLLDEWEREQDDVALSVEDIGDRDRVAAVVDLLLEAGVDPDAVDCEGQDTGRPAVGNDYGALPVVARSA